MGDRTIRQVTGTDHDEWLRLRRALWPDYSVEHLEQELAAIATRPERSPVFVVQRPNERLGGFLEANLRSTAHGCTTSPVAYIEGWYVDPDLRRCGLGAALVAAAEAWARTVPCGEIASDCALDNNINFRAHTRLGYIEEGRLIAFRKVLSDSKPTEAK
jgi:aminoglycoside 6'-N-acetyltransferase I